MPSPSPPTRRSARTAPAARAVWAVLTTAALGIAACSADDAASEETGDAVLASTTTAPPPDPAPTTVTGTPTSTIDPTEARTAAQVNEYIAQAAAFDQVAADAQFPAGLAFAAGGAPGYSRYVFREHSEGVVPTLVEGPLSGTVRCQDETLPCSDLELKELAASGAPIPRRSAASPGGAAVPGRPAARHDPCAG